MNSLTKFFVPFLSDQNIRYQFFLTFLGLSHLNDMTAEQDQMAAQAWEGCKEYHVDFVKKKFNYKLQKALQKIDKSIKI